MRGSKQGWIYLEGHMDTNIIQLLRHTPGIIYEGVDIKQQAVDFPDWTKMLDWVTTPKKIFKPNQWVRVRSGTYKGDIGFVIGISGLRGGTALNPPSAGGQYYIGTTIETKTNPAPTSASVIGPHCFQDCLQHWPHHGKGGHFHFKRTPL